MPQLLSSLKNFFPPVAALATSREPSHFRLALKDFDRIVGNSDPVCVALSFDLLCRPLIAKLRLFAWKKPPSHPLLSSACSAGLVHRLISSLRFLLHTLNNKVSSSLLDAALPIVRLLEDAEVTANEETLLECLRCLADILRSQGPHLLRPPAADVATTNIGPEDLIGLLLLNVLNFLNTHQHIRPVIDSCLSVVRAVPTAVANSAIVCRYYPGVCTALTILLCRADYKLGSAALVTACSALEPWIDWSMVKRESVDVEDVWLTEAVEQTCKCLVTVLSYPSPVHDSNPGKRSLVKLCSSLYSNAGCSKDFRMAALEFFIVCSNSPDLLASPAVQHALSLTADSLGESADTLLGTQMADRFFSSLEVFPSKSSRDEQKLLYSLQATQGFVKHIAVKVPNIKQLFDPSRLGRYVLSLCSLDPLYIRNLLEDETCLVQCPTEQLQNDPLHALASLRGSTPDDMAFSCNKQMQLILSAQRTSVSAATGQLTRCFRLASQDSGLIGELCATLEAVGMCLSREMSQSLIVELFGQPDCVWELSSRISDCQGSSDISSWARRSVARRELGETSTASKLAMLRRCEVLFAVRSILQARRADEEAPNSDHMSACFLEGILEHLMGPDVWLDWEVLLSTFEVADGPQTGFPPVTEACAIAGFYFSVLISTLSSALEALYSVSGRQAVDQQVKFVLLPLLDKVGTSSFMVSATAMEGLLTLYQLLRGNNSETSLSECTAHNASPELQAVGWLLAEYSDYLVDDVSYILTFVRPVYSKNNARSFGSSVGGLLTAIIMFSPHSLIPSLSGIVRQLAEGTPEWGVQEMPVWVARVMAATCYLLSSKVLADRAQVASSPRVRTELRPHFWDLAIPIERRKPRDHSSCAEDDDSSDGDDTNHGGVSAANPMQLAAQDQLAAGRTPTDYAIMRQMANAILMRMRFHLSDQRLQVRCYAYSCLLRGLCVLSTKTNDLLPNVHHIWPNLCASLTAEAALPGATLGYGIVAYVAHLCGEFIRSRLTSDIFPTLRHLLISSGPPASQCDVSRNSYVYRFQLTCLRTLVLVCRDSDLIRLLSPQLTVVALRFMRSDAAESLRDQATALLRNAYISRRHYVSFALKLILQESSRLQNSNIASKCDSTPSHTSGASYLQLLGYLSETSTEVICDLCTTLDAVTVTSVISGFSKMENAVKHVPIASGSKVFRVWVNSLFDESRELREES
eukprot:GHVS01029145.1.p1 GENE.GHVS01029145.1~~GHVS01029145.1.p1  ORF type:complete len:1205 (+),score=144.79 GHVS01029145.1:19-3633(+)